MAKLGKWLGIVMLITLLSGCGLIGVGLRVNVDLLMDDEGVEISGSDIVLAVEEIDPDNIPKIEGEVRVKTTGTLGKLRLDNLIIQYAETSDAEAEESYIIISEQNLNVDSWAVGGISHEEPFSVEMPVAIANLLRLHPEQLLDKTYRIEFIITGRDGVTKSFNVSFVERFE